MFLFVCGLPGELTDWCEAVALELARHSGGSAQLIRGDTLEQVALSAIAAGASHGVVSSRQPGGRLRKALLDSGRHFIVALDDPRTALVFLVLGRGVATAAAVQQLAGSCATLRGFAAAPGALIVEGSDVGALPDPAAADIARHLGIAIDDAEITALAARSAEYGAARRRHDAAAWWSGLDPDEQAMAIGALAPFVDEPPPGQPLSITWTRQLFFLGDRPDERLAGPVDITGRARCLLHGPYIALPPGAWSLTLAAEFSHAAVEHEFAVELCGDQPLASGSIRAAPDGRAELTLDFALDDSTEHPVALRLSSQRAAFDGTIALAGATLVRAAEAPAETRPAAAALNEA